MSTHPRVAFSFLLCVGAGALLSCGGTATDRDGVDGERQGSSGGDGDEVGEEVAPAGISTGSMFAAFEFLALGDGTTVARAELRVGGPNGAYVQLTGDDELVATWADEEVRMAHNSTGDRHFYLARAMGEEGGTSFGIELVRGAGHAGAPSSSVVLPPPFSLALSELEVGAEWARGNDLTVTWEPAAEGDINWRLEGDCLWSREGTSTDDGALTILAEDIEALAADADESCNAEVIIERVMRGTLDSALEGGQILGIQRRTIEFVSAPDEA